MQHLLPASDRPAPARRRSRAWLLVALLGLAAAAHDAGASVVRALGLDELVDRARTIAVVRVESAAAAWRDGRIVTDSVLVVTEGVQDAAAGERLAVRTLGGEVDGIGQRVFGEPRFRSGERYLVFLERLATSATEADGSPSTTVLLRPVGMSQGALPVTDAAGTPLVAPNPDLPDLVLPDVAVSVAPWLDAPRPLADVLAEVRVALAARGRDE